MGEKDGEKKNGNGPITVVLKLDLHCEGCAQKVKRSIRHFEGVDKVKTDNANNKLTVTGAVNPERLRERVEYKTKKKVELLSPQIKKDGAGGDKKADAKPEKKEGKEENKPKQPSVSTAILKIRLHCDGCIHTIKRIISKTDGVDDVTPDAKNDLVTVKGTMEVKELVSYLKEKLKRSVEIVPAKKDDGGGGDKQDKDGGGDKKEKAVGVGGDKKDKEAGGDKKDKDGGGDKKEKAVGGGGDKKDKETGSGDKKEKGGGGGVKKEKGGDGDKKKDGGGEAKVEGSKMEYHGYDPYTTYILPPYNHNYSSANHDYGTTSVPMYKQNYSNQNYGITTYDQGYVNHGYHVVEEYSHAPPPPPLPYYHAANAPQMFSDENPNACSIM